MNTFDSATMAAVGANSADGISLEDAGLPAEGVAEVESVGLSADEAAGFGWEDPGQVEQSLEDRLLDPEQAPSQLESAEVTETSPGSGPAQSPAPAPQLDANTQVMMALVQQMQQDAARREQVLMAQLESLKPKEAPKAPEDPFADLPPEFNDPKIKAFAEYMRGKVLSPLQEYQKQMEDRISEARQQREVQQYSNEADAAARAVLARGFALEGHEASVVSDGLRDMALTLSSVHGGTPAKYQEALNRIIDTAVNGRIKHLNSQAKAKVAQRMPPTPQRQVASAAIPQSQQTEPTLAEVRAAGYRDLEEARWNDFSKVYAKRARQGRG